MMDKSVYVVNMSSCVFIKTQVHLFFNFVLLDTVWVRTNTTKCSFVTLSVITRCITLSRGPSAST